MTRQPALFVSHGSPMIVAEPSPARTFMEGWSARATRPDAILVATAHFEARGGPVLTSAAQPTTIHDFGGFPDILYRVRYPAPGDPRLAARAAALLADAGFAPQLDAHRGLDHGAWTPLKLMYPDADIPVVQMSVDPTQDAAWHVRVGQALAPLRDENVLIVGSGAMTHNLRDFFGRRRAPDDAPEPYAAAFVDWARDAIEHGRTDDLIHWQTRAPFALKNHPTPEHVLPLFVALGAGGAAAGQRVHGSFSHGILAMDAYAFA
jgi:4,5-DOPA dioxygenase extradiol